MTEPINTAGIASDVERAKEATRFWAKVDVRAPDECWLWLASKTASGYGYFSRNRKNYRAHRIVWEICNNQPFPAGMHALHSCDNPSCVNPAHIRPGTHHENMAECLERGRWSCGEVKTHCLRGHELSGSNLLPGKLKQGLRACRKCNRLHQNAYDARKVENRG